MMRRLDEIVAALDADETPLEASITLYEEGITLVERCALALKGAETRLKELRRRADGVFETIDAREAEQ
jgi:exodeoxyribonuclease VII small subunit